jgi:hypothetical protein
MVELRQPYSYRFIYIFFIAPSFLQVYHIYNTPTESILFMPTRVYICVA